MRVYEYTGDLDIQEVLLDLYFINDLHRIAFTELYDWAGEFRNVMVTVGRIEVSQTFNIRHDITQMLDNINYRINHIRNIPKLSDEYSIRIFV